MESTVQRRHSADAHICRDRQRRQRILRSSPRFPEPCGRSGLQPSPKHVLGEALNDVVSFAIRELLELVAALDRRVPQVQRAGEAAIARDASALKARALQRVAHLERVRPGVEEI